MIRIVPPHPVYRILLNARRMILSACLVNSFKGSRKDKWRDDLTAMQSQVHCELALVSLSLGVGDKWTQRRSSIEGVRPFHRGYVSLETTAGEAERLAEVSLKIERDDAGDCGHSAFAAECLRLQAKACDDQQAYKRRAAAAAVASKAKLLREKVSKLIAVTNALR